MSAKTPLEVPNMRHVSPKLAPAVVLTQSIMSAVMVLVACVVAYFSNPWVWLIAAAIFVVGVWMVWLRWRRARILRYAVRETDLVIRNGVMFQRLVMIPFGRLQFVDVQAGPIFRAFGLATVQLHTASPSTSAALPGLTTADAEQLRETLLARGKAFQAGL